MEPLIGRVIYQNCTNLASEKDHLVVLNIPRWVCTTILLFLRNTIIFIQYITVNLKFNNYIWQVLETGINKFYFYTAYYDNR